MFFQIKWSDDSFLCIVFSSQEVYLFINE